MLDHNALRQQPDISEKDDTENLSKIRRDLLRYCEFLGGSRHEAEDIVQTTLLKALPILKGTSQHPNVTALLRRIAKNTWFDHVRKLGKCVPCSPMDLSMWLGFVEQAVPLDIEAALHVLVSRLSSRQRIVFLLCEVYAFTDREVAEMLDMSRGAIKALLHRARVRIHSPEANLALPGDSEEPQREILKAYVAAFRAADISALIHLCEDGTLDPMLATSKALTFAERQQTAVRKGGTTTMSLHMAA